MATQGPPCLCRSNEHCQPIPCQNTLPAAPYHVSMPWHFFIKHAHVLVCSVCMRLRGCIRELLKLATIKLVVICHTSACNMYRHGHPPICLPVHSSARSSPERSCPFPLRPFRSFSTFVHVPIHRSTWPVSKHLPPSPLFLFRSCPAQTHPSADHP